MSSVDMTNHSRADSDSFIHLSSDNVTATLLDFSPRSTVDTSLLLKLASDIDHGVARVSKHDAEFQRITDNLENLLLAEEIVKSLELHPSEHSEPLAPSEPLEPLEQSKPLKPSETSEISSEQVISNAIASHSTPLAFSKYKPTASKTSGKLEEILEEDQVEKLYKILQPRLMGSIKELLNKVPSEQNAINSPKHAPGKNPLLVVESDLDMDLDGDDSDNHARQLDLSVLSPDTTPPNSRDYVEPSKISRADETDLAEENEAAPDVVHDSDCNADRIVNHRLGHRKGHAFNHDVDLDDYPLSGLDESNGVDDDSPEKSYIPKSWMQRNRSPSLQNEVNMEEKKMLEKKILQMEQKHNSDIADLQRQSKSIHTTLTNKMEQLEADNQRLREQLSQKTRSDRSNLLAKLSILEDENNRLMIKLNNAKQYKEEIRNEQEFRKHTEKEIGVNEPKRALDVQPPFLKLSEKLNLDSIDQLDSLQLKSLVKNILLTFLISGGDLETIGRGILNTAKMLKYMALFSDDIHKKLYDDSRTKVPSKYVKGRENQDVEQLRKCLGQMKQEIANKISKGAYNTETT